MKILGVDQSYSSSGLVVFDTEINDVIHFELFKTNKVDDIFKRAWMISHHILGICKDMEIDKVAIEGLAFGMRGDATRDLAGLQFAIVMQLKYVGNLEVVIVSPKSLKLFATKSGKADKQQMIDSVPTDILDKFKASGAKKTTGLADIVDAYYLAKYLVPNAPKIE